jgi:hypothetical protein
MSTMAARQAIVRRFAESIRGHARRGAGCGSRAILLGNACCRCRARGWDAQAAGQMAFSALTINPEAQPFSDGLREKQFLAPTRVAAYYRQRMPKKNIEQAGG